jgi:formyltetrahydrofolate-dependent phosphoribosylglycinamide formyltransferase
VTSAVFLDRDGTIIEDVGYLRDPGQVRLLPGAADAIRRLNQRGLVTIVVTNQSGIARALLSTDDYYRTEQRLDQLLAASGARVDGHYFCPHLPEVSGPCECRKPGTLLYRQAAERFGIELGRSWWIGDKERDVLPAEAFGGRGILLHDGFNLSSAVDLVLASSPVTMRVAVAISGRGSNLESLLQALGPSAPAEVVLVVSDREAPGLSVARARNIPALVLSRPSEVADWLEALRRHRVDLVVLAGYLKLVPAAVIAEYRDRIINIHPALLPEFGGKGMYGRRVHEAVLASGARESGASVHLVDERYDQGAVLAQARVPVLAGDTADDLAHRVLAEEHRLLPAVVLAAARAGRPVALPAHEGRAHDHPAQEGRAR